MRLAVIDASAQGYNLRPLTHDEMPTAFLALGESRTLLQRAVDRLGDVIPSENIWVLVGHRLRAKARKDLKPGIHIIDSDGGFFTALSQVVSNGGAQKNEATTILIESATHMVKNDRRFRQCLIAGFEKAELTGQAVAFATEYEKLGLPIAGFQCWPLDQLSARLKSSDLRSMNWVSHLLASTEDKMQVASLADVGWVTVDDWESVKHLLGYVEKPWGHERLWALNRNYAGKILFIKAGESLSLQYHEVKDETIRIVSGRMRFLVGPSIDRLEAHILEPGMSYEISPRVIHQMEALEDCTFIEVSTPHLTDVIRLEDRYGRT